MKPDTPVWVQMVAVCIVIFNTVLSYGSVAALFSSNAAQLLYVRIQRPINRVTGAMMIGFGGKLVLVRD